MIVKVSEAREIEIVKIYLGVNLKLELIKNDDGNHYYNCIMNPFQEDDIATITAYNYGIGNMLILAFVLFQT